MWQQNKVKAHFEMKLDKRLQNMYPFIGEPIILSTYTRNIIPYLRLFYAAVIIIKAAAVIQYASGTISSNYAISNAQIYHSDRSDAIT